MRIIIAMYALLIPLAALYLKISSGSKGREPASVIIKGASTGVIVLAALTGLTLRGGGVPLFDGLIVVGLTLGLVGDIVIGATLLGGMGAFALGHLCYIAALLNIPGSHSLAVPIWAALYVGLYFAYKKSGISLGKFELPCCVYSAVICVMLSLALAGARLSAVLPLAALLFTASDLMLVTILFGGKKGAAVHGVCLWCYFIGQSLFAVTVITGL